LTADLGCIILIIRFAESSFLEIIRDFNRITNICRDLIFCYCTLIKIKRVNQGKKEEEYDKLDSH